MVPFFKTQWHRVLIGLISLVLGIVYLCQGNDISGILWLLSSVTWCAGANSNYNEECIKVLLKRVEQLENRAITDTDEISKNNFIVNNKL